MEIQALSAHPHAGGKCGIVLKLKKQPHQKTKWLQAEWSSVTQVSVKCYLHP